MKQIGFIGASGLMGHGMARNLQAKGFELTLLLHRNRDRVSDLLGAGAREAANAAALGQCDAVILCVTGSPQVEQVLAGPQGLLVQARAGLLVIDTLTGDTVEWVRIEGVVRELYDVAALPGVRNAGLIGFMTDEVHRVIAIDDGEAGT